MRVVSVHHTDTEGSQSNVELLKRGTEVLVDIMCFLKNGYLINGEIHKRSEQPQNQNKHKNKSKMKYLYSILQVRMPRLNVENQINTWPVLKTMRDFCTI